MFSRPIFPIFPTIVAATTAVLLLSGCVTAALTGLGLGGATAVNHTLAGIGYKTFTAPLPEVRLASIYALRRMGIKVANSSVSEGNAVVNAFGKDRDIEMVFEPISSNTTRMRVIARTSSVFLDSATASEIIVQTERVLAEQTQTNAPAPSTSL